MTVLRLLLIAALLAAAPSFAQKYEPHVGQAGKDVIWVPTPDDVVDRMLTMAQVGPGDIHFDLGAGNTRPYQQLDFRVLTGWLRAILETDPRSGYPLFAAARIYAEVPDADRSRLMLEFVHQAFLEDPNRRWPFLAHAALLAKHRLKDLPLARRYAADLQRLTTASDVSGKAVRGRRSSRTSEGSASRPKKTANPTAMPKPRIWIMVLSRPRAIQWQPMPMAAATRMPMTPTFTPWPPRWRR